MKKINLLLLSLIVVMLHSCKTASVYTNVLVPAQITIPQHIQTVGILNRSLPGKGEGWRNFLEGFISGESIMADREGSYNVCKGLAFKIEASQHPGSVSKSLEYIKLVRVKIRRVKILRLYST